MSYEVLLPVENDYEFINSINNTNIPQANIWIQEVAEATGCKYADSACVWVMPAQPNVAR